jgi:hypothetical protein
VLVAVVAFFAATNSNTSEADPVATFTEHRLRLTGALAQISPLNAASFGYKNALHGIILGFSYRFSMKNRTFANLGSHGCHGVHGKV